MALLLPAVQKVRAAADRLICANNLKQIGIACHHFHGDYGRFPPGYASSLPYVDGANDTSPGWSWAAYLLPYIEQDSTYKLITLSRPVEHPANAAGIAARIKL